MLHVTGLGVNCRDDTVNFSSKTHVFFLAIPFNLVYKLFKQNRIITPTKQRGFKEISHRTCSYKIIYNIISL